MNILENIVKPSLIVLMLWLKLQILFKTFVHHQPMKHCSYSTTPKDCYLIVDMYKYHISMSI